MIQDYIPHYYASPSLVHALIPEECRNAHSLLRWWQSVDTKLGIDNVKKSPAWTVDNIAIEYSHNQLLEIYDNFKYEYHIKIYEKCHNTGSYYRDGSFNRTQWHFHPNGFFSNNFCGIPDTESSLNFISTENSRFVGITSKHVVVKDNYAAHFKVTMLCAYILFFVK